MAITIWHLFTTVCLLLNTAACFQESEFQKEDDAIIALRAKALATYRQGKYEDAFKAALDLAQQRPGAVNNQLLLGEISFAAGKMKACVSAYDAVVKLNAEYGPQLWQRGLALYYAERFEDGVKQFETHQTVNTQDVENSVWHLLCAAKTEKLQSARKQMIPIEGDERVPMSAIYEMFAGRSNPENVLKAAQKTSTFVREGTPQYKLQLYYAHLYIGLYHEMNGDHKAAKKSLELAQEINPLGKTNFMGQVARVHLKLRNSK